MTVDYYMSVISTPNARPMEVIKNFGGSGTFPHFTPPVFPRRPGENLTHAPRPHSEFSSVNGRRRPGEKEGQQREDANRVLGWKQELDVFLGIMMFQTMSN